MTEEDARLMERFEDEYLVELAEKRLKVNEGKELLEWDELLRRCGIDPNDPLDDVEVEIE
ncbi:MAG: hypothetical protein IKZ87_07275 [Actinomycetaceae bacterium]|nr:hypothetical protein [Actinomycetaceae bacterium]